MKNKNVFSLVLPLCLASFFSLASFAEPTGVMQEWSRRPAFVNPLTTTNNSTFEEWQGGYWNAKNLSGKFRFVVTKSENRKTNQLFIQWLSAEAGDIEVFYSVSIDELNSLPRYSFGLPRCVRQDCHEIQIVALDVFEDKQLAFNMVLEGVGQYRMKI